MNALTAFLEGEAYRLLLARIQEADPAVDFDDTLDSFRLMKCFKQRHYVLKGFQERFLMRYRPQHGSQRC